MTQARLEAIVKQVRLQTGVPGLALCLELNGERRFAASGSARAGTDMPITREARFDVSCLMKFFLSTTALKLAARGEIDLQADIASMLPELGPPRGIRLIHLMSHASGCHGVDITDMTVRWGSRWEAFAARFRGAPQLFAPGSTFNYEHSEHVILGEALRRMLGSGPSELVHAELLAPAGITLQDAAAGETGILPHAFSAQRGAYAPTKLPPFGPFWEASLPALTISLDEVVSAAQAALADGAIATALRKPLIALPKMARSENRAEKPPRQFSAACGLYDDGLAGHNGSMFGQTVGFRIDPHSGAVVATGVNAYSAHARDTVLRRALDRLEDEEPQSPAQPLRYARDEIFGGLSPQACEGRYIGSYLGEITVAREGADLRVAVGPDGNRQSVFKIVSQDGGYAIQSRMPVALRFQPAPDGAAALFLGVHAYKAVGRKPRTGMIVAETVDGV